MRLRSRSFSAAARAGLLLLLSSALASAASAVVGVDLGQEFIKAALVKPGIPLEIVLTKDSKRKEASAIGFKPSNSPGSENYPERLYGGDALTLAARFPSDVYPNLKQLLGKDIAQDQVSTYSTRYPALKIASTPERSTVGFQSAAANRLLTVEELMAMQLKAVIAQAQALAGSSVSQIRDVVFTIPAWFNAEEKNALLAAAELAGLKVMSFVTDGLAVGINYAISRTFDLEKPEYHIVYDMGAGSTTATLLKFQGKSVKDVGRFNKTVQDVKVMGVGYDTTLGGDLFNEKVVNILLDDFITNPKGKKALEGKENPKKVVRSNGRAAAKLWREATRIRQILSANTETFSSIESLYDDIDFRSKKILRSTFEDAIKEYELRITKPIHTALKAAGLTLEQINTVIVHGGGVRTPFVGKRLEELVGAGKISKNVNSDEAAVFGATFKGAGESGSFKVKDIRTHDTNPYPVSLSYKDQPASDADIAQEVFPAGSPPGKEKIVTFPQNQDFVFSLVHDLPNDSNPRVELLHKVNVENVTASVKKLKEDYKCAEADILTRFAIRLNKKFGLPTVTRGWVECEVEVPSEAEKKEGEGEGIVDGVKDFFGFGKKKDASSESGDSSGGSGTSSSSSAKKSKGSKTSSSTSSSSTPEPPKTIRKTMRYPLIFKPTKLGTPSLSSGSKSEITKNIKAFDTADSTRRKLEETRNSLESYAYSALNQLSDTSFVDASAPGIRDSLSSIFSSATEWLYSDEGIAAPLDKVNAKFDEVKKIHTPIIKRMKEHTERPEAVKSLRQATEQLRDVVKVLKEREGKSAEELEVFTEKEIDEMDKLGGSIEEWVEDMIKKQEIKEAWEDPTVTVAQLQGKVKEVADHLVAVVEKKMKAAEKKRREEEKKKREEERKKKEEEKKAKEEEEKKKKEEAGEEKEGESVAPSSPSVTAEEPVKSDETKTKQEPKKGGHDEL